MSTGLRGTLAFKRFLVFFWCIWWLFLTISHIIGIAQFWNWLPGHSLTADYVRTAYTIGASHVILYNVVFVAVLLLQIIASIHFLRALFTMNNDNWLNQISHAFVYSLALFMLLYAAYLLFQFLGANYTVDIREAMSMIYLQFLCTLFVIKA